MLEFFSQFNLFDLESVMIPSWPCVCWRLGLAGILAVGEVISSGVYISAQIIPDGTLGSESSVVTPNVTIRELPGDRIDAGAVRGANLFHSFSQFNVRELQRVYFANPAWINNILLRVTGTELSKILGTLGVLGNANLFLINPNGIFFGPNARLDLRGSFVATTASGIQLGENGLFSATDPQNSQLLSIQPGALFLNALAQHQATIRNEGNLAVGQDLTLAAGNLELQGQLSAVGNLTLHALDTLRVRDSAIAPFIAAAGNQLLMQGDRGIDIFVLNHPYSGLFSGGDLVLRSTNPVGGDAHYWSGGSFRIEQLDGSLGNLVSFYDPIIRSQGDVSFFAYQGPSLHILAGGSVNINTAAITEPDTAGNTINPTATPALANITLSDGTSLIIDGSARSTLDVRAGMKSEAIGTPLGTLGGASGTFFDPDLTPIPPPANNPVATSANINITSIFNNGGVVFLTNQYQPNPALSGGITLGAIDTSSDLGGGSVVIDSRGGITVNDLLNVSGTSDNPLIFNFSGDGGNVILLANGDITFNPGASVLSFGLLGGNILLKSAANISVTSGAIDSLSSTPVTGTTGGEIKFMGRSLSISNGSELGTFTFGEANAGNVIIQASDSVSVDGRGFLTGVVSQVLSGARGNGGNLTIETERLLVRDGAQIATSTFGEGDAGDLMVTAQSVELIGTTVDGEFSSGLFAQADFVEPDLKAKGSGGNLTIETERLLVRDGARVSVSTFSEGDAGDLTVTAQSVELIGTAANGQSLSGLFAQAEQGASGRGGNLRIDTEHLLVRDGAQVFAGTLGEGDAGNLTVTAQSIELIGTSVNNSRLGSGLLTSVQPGASGDGGNLRIDAGRFLLRDGAQVSASTSGEGNAGDLTVTAQLVEVIGTSADGQFGSGLFTSVQPGARGSGGNLRIDAGRFLMRDGAQIATSTFGEGDAGDLTVTAQSVEVIGTSADGQFVSGLFTSVQPGARGSGGNLRIDAGRFLVRDGAQVSASTSGQGDAGDLTVTAQSVEVIGTSANGRFPSALSAGVASGASGDGGNLTIETERLLVRDGAEVSVETRGAGRAGDATIRAETLTVETGGRISATSAATAIAERGGSLTVNASQLNLSGNGGLFATTEGATPAGTLSLRPFSNDPTLRVNLSDGARISASTSGTGLGGSLIVTAPESVTIRGNGQLSVETSGAGSAGNLNINTQQLTIEDGAQATVSSTGTGRAGNLEVNARHVLLNNRARLAAETESSNGGDITLNGLDTLEVFNSRISASTIDGSAGSLRVNATKSVQLRGEDGLSVEATGQGGIAGDLTVTTGQLLVEDGATINVSSPLGQAGNIGIAANSLSMDRGFITAETEKSGSEEGANIRLKVADTLLMSNESLISANAFNRANGGNIDLDTKFLIALPPKGANGSDIRANAEFGSGGQVNITAQGILGLEFRESLTPLNDITASSEFGTAGSVALDTPNTDPNRGLNAPSARLVDPSKQIAQGCTPNVRQGASQFVVTGRGGLPLSPDEPLESRAVVMNWVELPEDVESGRVEESKGRKTSPSNPQPSTEIVEAQGWKVDSKGNIVLVAQLPVGTPAVNPRSPVSPPSCY